MPRGIDTRNPATQEALERIAAKFEREADEARAVWERTSLQLYERERAGAAMRAFQRAARYVREILGQGKLFDR